MRLLFGQLLEFLSIYLFPFQFVLTDQTQASLTYMCAFIHGRIWQCPWYGKIFLSLRCVFYKTKICLQAHCHCFFNAGWTRRNNKGCMQNYAGRKRHGSKAHARLEGKRSMGKAHIPCLSLGQVIPTNATNAMYMFGKMLFVSS